jgi:hypothetical protein
MANYLDNNLKPLYEEIELIPMQSTLARVHGFNEISTNSRQSQIGFRLEDFWNKVISDSKCENLIETDKKVFYINVKGKQKQVDHHFKANDGKTYYLESKCHLGLDSEKIKASDQKILDVREALGADLGGYFVPVMSDIEQKYLTKYNKIKEINVYGVKWMLSKIDTQFTEAEYFESLPVYGALIK